VEDLFPLLQNLPPHLIYLAVFTVALVENIFPPSPSDLVVVFAGSLVAIGQAGFAETLFAASAGSTIGFLIMYKAGAWFGRSVIEQGRIRFLPMESVKKVEEWFSRFGYWIIIANRFLSGTRAVVSFFAGLSEMNIPKTTALSFLSALAWNSILLGAGYLLGTNWQQIGFYLSTYAQVITSLILLCIIIWIIYTISRNNEKGEA
jgi:membrane protein DedA with SNARE-associated domain